MPDKPIIQQVNELIISSSGLKPEEAIEWLRLVPLMNDQQIWEVMRILKAMNAQKPVTSNKYQVSSDKTKFPNDISNPNTPSYAKASAGGQYPSSNKQVDPKLALSAGGLSSSAIPAPYLAGTALEPLKPAGSPNPIPDVLSARLIQSIVPGSSQSQIVDRGGTQAVIEQRYSDDDAAPLVVGKTGSRRGVALHQINELEDLSGITVAGLRAWGEEGLFSAIKPIVEDVGWAIARLEFEKSPLFLAYVDAGRKTLGDDTITSQAGDIERHEFEAVADLLRRLAIVG